MTHDKQAFFRELEELQNRYLCNISAEANRVVFDFADDPRLVLVKRRVMENGRMVIREIAVLKT